MLDTPVNEMPPPNVMKHHIPTSKGHQLKKNISRLPPKSHSPHLLHTMEDLYLPSYSTIQDQTRNHRVSVFLNLFPHCSCSKCHKTVRCAICNFTIQKCEPAFAKPHCCGLYSIMSPKCGHKRGPLRLRVPSGTSSLFSL